MLGLASPPPILPCLVWRHHCTGGWLLLLELMSPHSTTRCDLMLAASSCFMVALLQDLMGSSLHQLPCHHSGTPNLLEIAILTAIQLVTASLSARHADCPIFSALAYQQPCSYSAPISGRDMPVSESFHPAEEAAARPSHRPRYQLDHICATWKCAATAVWRTSQHT